MKRRLRPLAVVLAMGVLCSSSGPAWAGPPTDQLKAAVDRVIRILEDPTARFDVKMKERRAAIREEADGIFDFRETAKRALGTHWPRLGEKDQEEFVSLFADLLERAYDVVIEGVSLVANYRVQFDKIIHTASYADLVTRLKK